MRRADALLTTPINGSIFGFLQYALLGGPHAAA